MFRRMPAPERRVCALPHSVRLDLGAFRRGLSFDRLRAATPLMSRIASKGEVLLKMATQA